MSSSEIMLQSSESQILLLILELFSRFLYSFLHLLAYTLIVFASSLDNNDISPFYNWNKCMHTAYMYSIRNQIHVILILHSRFPLRSEIK